jgi:hypothetical protein
LTLKYKNTTNLIYLVGDLIEENNIYTCTITIDSTGYIDEDNMLEIVNYQGNISDAAIELDSISSFILYSVDTSLAVAKTYIIDEVYDTNSTCDIYKETMNVVIGKEIPYLYNKYSVDYTNRKYLKYTENVYLTYKDNVYEMDEHGIVVNYVDTDDDDKADTAVPVLLHSKGDYVLDDNGDKIILHSIGDIILNENNEPTLDVVYGMLHNVSIMLLEYEYKLVTNETYMNYIIDNYKYLTDMNTTILGNINDKLLDNTVIKYKPLTILENINLIVNKVTYNTPNFITPIITVYLKDVIVDNKVYILLKNTLDIILQNGLREELPISDIVDNMLTYKDLNILSINITNIDNIGDVNIKVYTDNSSRFVIDKKLMLDEEGKITVGLNTILNVLTI